MYLPHRDDSTSQSSQSEDEVNITWYNNESKETPKEILNVLEQQVITSSEDIFTIASNEKDSAILSSLNPNKTTLNVSNFNNCFKHASFL